MEIKAEEIRQLGAAQAARLMEAAREGGYTLLDVRQPQEYEAGHLPGARLLPLSELEEQAGGLDRGHPVITYCRSGNRSRAAAALLMGKGFPEVYTLAGGVAGWGHPLARGWPRVHLMTGAEDLLTALNLVFFMERGSEGFYRSAAGRAQDEDVARLLAELARAEVGHMHLVYGELSGKVKGELPAFEEYYELASSDLMEAGLKPEEYLGRLEELATADEAHVLETAMELEVLSLDLYRNLARQAADAEVSGALLEMSDQEKAHLRLLAGKLGEVALRQAG